MTEQEFRLHADRALEGVQRSLLPLADEQGFEVELQNAPVRQIWVSAMSRSYKLAWSPDGSAFTLDGESLSTLVERLARQHLSS
jgi:iron-sulfur cluster assembly protein CyaY